MSSRHDHHDFYVAPPARAVKFAPAGSWFIYRGHPSLHLCIAVCADRERAVEHAVHLAMSRSSHSEAIQVHVSASSGSWSTVWCSPGSEPRYGARERPRRQA